MATEIPVLRPLYDEQEEQAVTRVLRSGWTGSGPEVALFEREFAEYLELEPWQVITTSSCTAALHLALTNVPGLNAASEVLVPAITFVSTAAAVRAAGAKLIFGDVYPSDLTLRQEWLTSHSVWEAPANITDRTKVIIPVHLAGAVASIEPDLLKLKGIEVIEDCAHAVGTKVAGKHVGTDPRSLFSCFSFNAVKNIGAGDGGAVITHDRWTANRLRKQRWCGIDKDTHSRLGGAGYTWQYVIDEVGMKCQMSELNAAVARVQLRKINSLNGRRKEVAAQYREALKDISWLTLPSPPEPGIEVSNHLFIARTDRRDALVAHLKALNIVTGVHYKPVNLQPAYRGLNYPTPVAHAEWLRLVSLPMHAALTDQDVARVIAAIQSFA